MIFFPSESKAVVNICHHMCFIILIHTDSLRLPDFPECNCSNTMLETWPMWKHGPVIPPVPQGPAHQNSSSQNHPNHSNTILTLKSRSVGIPLWFVGKLLIFRTVVYNIRFNNEQYLILWGFEHNVVSPTEPFQAEGKTWEIFFLYLGKDHWDPLYLLSYQKKSSFCYLSFWYWKGKNILVVYIHSVNRFITNTSQKFPFSNL